MTGEAGLIALVYRVLRDAWTWAAARLRKPDPAQIVAARKKWKEEFEKRPPMPAGKFSLGRVIVRDVAKLDSYPEVESRKRGISPWFRVNLGALYHRGLMVVLRVQSLRYLESIGAWRLATADESESAVPAYLVGKIRFENIVEVDWNGDEYYGEPHLYCRFSEKGRQPYESLTYYAEYETHHGSYFTELVSHGEILRNSRKYKHVAA